MLKASINWVRVSDIDYSDMCSWTEDDIYRVINLIASKKFQSFAMSAAGMRPTKYDADLSIYRSECWTMTEIALNRRLDAAYNKKEKRSPRKIKQRSK